MLIRDNDTFSQNLNSKTTTKAYIWFGELCYDFQNAEKFMKKQLLAQAKYQSLDRGAATWPAVALVLPSRIGYATAGSGNAQAMR